MSDIQRTACDAPTKFKIKTMHDDAKKQYNTHRAIIMVTFGLILFSATLVFCIHELYDPKIMSISPSLFNALMNVLCVTLALLTVINVFKSIHSRRLYKRANEYVPATDADNLLQIKKLRQSNNQSIKHYIEQVNRQNREVYIFEIRYLNTFL